MTGLHKIRERVSREEIEAFSRVFKVVAENEHDGDHVQSLFIDYGDVMKWYGEVIWPDGEPTSEDVETALKFARDYVGESFQRSISLEVGEGKFRSLPPIEDESLLLI